MRKIFFVILFLLLVGCDKQVENENLNVLLQDDLEILSEEEQMTRAIDEVLSLKLRAWENNDLNAYIATVNPNDDYYLNEQKRWFSEMSHDEIKNLSFEIKAIEILDPDTCIVEIIQKHDYKEHIEITYPLKMIQISGVWYDAGYPFEVKKTERYTLKYMPDETRVYAFLDVINTAYDNLEEIFEERPDPNFEIKLYSDRELLRQRTIPTIGWLFTGWGEANESLKIYTGHTSIDGYRGTLQHELIHHITMNICQNNLPGWLADGIALHYGNYYLQGGNPFELGYASKDELAWTIEKLSRDDLWDASDQSETENWYNASAMYVAFIIDQYGHDGLMAVFYKAGEKPYHENILNEDFSKKNSETFDEVIEVLWSINSETLSQDYLNWLEKQ